MDAVWKKVLASDRLMVDDRPLKGGDLTRASALASRLIGICANENFSEVVQERVVPPPI